MKCLPKGIKSGKNHSLFLLNIICIPFKDRDLYDIETGKNEGTCQVYDF